MKNFTFKQSYDSDSDDILDDFYIPALSRACKYDRLAGFFSSTSLAIAARGIVPFIANKGRMRLIASPYLSKQDAEILRATQSTEDTNLVYDFNQELEKFEDMLLFEHLRALGWMIAHKYLEIRLAFVLDSNRDYVYGRKINTSSVFHQKVGIISDKEGDALSFSGSVNESASGWASNIEEFKVFRSWKENEIFYLETDRNKFSAFWDNEASSVEVIALPKAFEKSLVRIAPDDIADLRIVDWYSKRKNRKVSGIQLYDYQREALHKWENNNCRGILSMATGTGKTFTALGCAERFLSRNLKNALVITCPMEHLINQWESSIHAYWGEKQILKVASSNPRWKDSLADWIRDIKLGYRENIIIISTHDSFASGYFVDKINELDDSCSVMLIADEVHGLGAPVRQRGLIARYDSRLGLSATPKRYMDDYGTEVILSYFDDVVYSFDIGKAQNTINPQTQRPYLASYNYYPLFVHLSDEELDEYKRKTSKAMGASKFTTVEEEERYHLILIERADIIKNAEEKISMFDDSISQLITNHTLVYCAPGQVEPVLHSLFKSEIPAHKFTARESTKPKKKFGGISERQRLLQLFENGDYKVLVAMKCLDEGVDIRLAKTAVILSSSGNSREFIQRTGRVIRQHPSKNHAQIFDFVVSPNPRTRNPENVKIEKSIFEKELKRMEEIASHAANSMEVLDMIEKADKGGTK